MKRPITLEGKIIINRNRYLRERLFGLVNLSLFHTSRLLKMKSVGIIVCAIFVVVAISIIQVDATSPRKCGNCWPCEPVNCKCGTYKDECDCCDICKKCRGEVCQMVSGDVCEDGYTCGDPNRPLLEMINSAANCIPQLTVQRSSG